MILNLRVAKNQDKYKLKLFYKMQILIDYITVKKR
jgi:hypothetical protein